MNRMLYLQRLSLLGFLVLILTGCSPYLYKEQVATFDSGVEEASKAYKNRAQDMEKISVLSNLSVSGYPRLILKNGCQPEEEVCPITTKTGEPLSYSELIKDSHYAVLKALEGYSGALKEIVNAEDMTALKSANKDACEGIGEAVEAANLDPSDNYSPIVNGSCTIITKFTEVYLDEKRFRVLNHAVNQADPEVKKLANYMAEKAKLADKFLKRNANDNLTILLSTLPDNIDKTDDKQVKQYEKGLTDALAIYHKNQEALNTDLATAFNQLIKAHEALVEAVNDPNSQKDAALETVRDFYKTAKSLTQHGDEE